MSDALINAELTIGSLMVLGFNANDYIENFPGIAYGISNLTIYTFDKQNEKSLLVALHFLLSKLEPEDFPLSIEGCWPYLEVKTKNEFKRAIQYSFERLVRKEWLPTGICKASILSLAKGPEVWNLLRVLSDICVQVSIAELSNEPVESIAQRFHDDTVDIRATIDDELKLLESIIVSGVRTEKEHGSYFSELDVRLRKANKNIETSRKKLQAILTNDMPHMILTESGRLQRSEWIEKISNSKQLLLNLSESPLLAKAHELLQADKHLMETGQLPIQSRRFSALTPSKWEAVLDSAAAGELQKDETLQRNILDAINTLIEQIDQIPVV